MTLKKPQRSKSEKPVENSMEIENDGLLYAPKFIFLKTSPRICSNPPMRVTFFPSQPKAPLNAFRL